MQNRLARISLDHDIAVPLYQQLEQAFRQQIFAGLWNTGDVLPSERVLAEELNVSRVTVRKALDSLHTQGMIERRHGAGNYISPQAEIVRDQHTLTRLEGMTEMLKARGYAPSSEWLMRDIRVPPTDCLVRLGLQPETPVAFLKRKRMADSQIVAVNDHYIAADLLPNPEALHESLYRHLDQQGTPITRALQQVSAINATPSLSALLDVPEGTALLKSIRTGYLLTGRPVELTVTWCRTDCYDFMIEITR